MTKILNREIQCENCSVVVLKEKTIRGTKSNHEKIYWRTIPETVLPGTISTGLSKKYKGRSAHYCVNHNNYR